MSTEESSCWPAGAELVTDPYYSTTLAQASTAKQLREALLPEAYEDVLPQRVDKVGCVGTESPAGACLPTRESMSPLPVWAGAEIRG